MTDNIQTLDLETLAILQEDAARQADNAKRLAAQVQTELLRRYTEAAGKALTAKDEPFGSAHIFEGDFDLEVDQPKKVAWDQKLMADMYRELGAQADEYMEIEYNLPESRFKSLPQTQRDWFARARTVAPGKMKIVIKRKEQK